MLASSKLQAIVLSSRLASNKIINCSCRITLYQGTEKCGGYRFRRGRLRTT
jgi:hypothetical protein